MIAVRPAVVHRRHEVARLEEREGVGLEPADDPDAAGVHVGHDGPHKVVRVVALLVELPEELDSVARAFHDAGQGGCHDGGSLLRVLRELYALAFFFFWILRRRGEGGKPRWSYNKVTAEVEQHGRGVPQPRRQLGVLRRGRRRVHQDGAGAGDVGGDDVDGDGGALGVHGDPRHVGPVEAHEVDGVPQPPGAQGGLLGREPGAREGGVDDAQVEVDVLGYLAQRDRELEAGG